MAGTAVASLIRSQAWGGWESPFFSASFIFSLKEWRGKLFSFLFFPPFIPPGIAWSGAKPEDGKAKIKCQMFKCLETCTFLLRRIMFLEQESEQQAEFTQKLKWPASWKRNTCQRQQVNKADWPWEQDLFLSRSPCSEYSPWLSMRERGPACLPSDSGCFWSVVAKGWGF